MIIARSPLRISLGGGGTDLASYYSKYEGFLIAAAIDKYIYLTIHDIFVPEYIVKYSRLERVGSYQEVQHPIVRAALEIAECFEPGIEITSMADIPAGTGLGSSGSFTTALLKALYAHKRKLIHPQELAELACHIEIDLLKEPIGKQDQYISSYGGITCFDFKKDGTVVASPLALSQETQYALEDNLLLFFTGFSRSASSILKEQNDKSKQDDHEMIENLHFVKEIGKKSKVALECGDLTTFARLMDEHWQKKRKRSGNMSNDKINELYDTAMRNGALGGKLIGAGGGGFLMFYTEAKSQLRYSMRQCGLREVRFRFDFEGSKIVTS